jgi:hypothetical protein
MSDLAPDPVINAAEVAERLREQIARLREQVRECREDLEALNVRIGGEERFIPRKGR